MSLFEISIFPSFGFEGMISVTVVPVPCHFLSCPFQTTANVIDYIQLIDIKRNIAKI